MATSRPAVRVADWFSSRAHYLGSGAAVLGLATGLAADLGLWTVATTGALYGAGAALGVAFRKETDPPGPPDPRLAALAAELADWRRAPAGEWPAEAAAAAGELLTAADGALAGRRLDAVAVALTGTLDWYERALSWWRLEPQGAEPTPEFLRRVARAVERLA
ncbi:hypothetical protein [Kitasatospora viridis]|uniref:Uncharacterized protein n=1 Tax=Kitasatospora viridis TaxID=281105 RepID=A0A561UMD2_9ACTN|nr:hypothetical protein [Kitasatospora viridis]TWG00538.1 hypothetical protein FHX73_114417 [Kitasatospora viridis]